MAVRTVLRRARKQVRYVQVVPPAQARGAVAEVYAQARRDFGVLAPPLALHSPAPAALAAAWLLLRETLLADGITRRAARESVAAGVSRANACPYCVDVHQAAHAVLQSPSDDDAALAAWARSAGGSGQGPHAAVAPFSAQEAPELLGVAVTFHYLNRMVSIYLADSPMPRRTPSFLRGPIMRTVARAMRPRDRGPVVPGRSLRLLPAAPLPAGLQWAEPNPVVAEALGRAVAAVDGAALWLPEQVRGLVRARLAAWDGLPVGPSRAWLEEVLSELPVPDRAVARLALLTAFAPYQVMAEDVAAVRVRYPSDRSLIELTSWAALAAAVCVGGRLTVCQPAPGR
ncbi:carboxymuconolactone decarboxylase family protein [Streptomyces sp. NPDC003697]